MVKEIVMSSKENMEAASAIYNSFIQIKQEKMKKVLNDLEEKFNGVMDEEIKREQLQNFEKQIKVGHLQNFNEQINGYYKHSYQPGFAYKLIEFEIGDNGATEKYALFLRCEIDARLFLGFCVRQWSEGKKCYCDVFDDKNYPMPEKIKNRVNEYIEFSDSQYQGENGWLEWYYLPTRKRDDTEEEIPNFKHLSNGYFKLFDEEGKNEIIDKSVEGFEEMCHKIKWECIRRDLDK